MITNITTIIAIIICTPKFPAGQTAPHKNKLTAFKFPALIDCAPVNCELPRWQGLRLFGLDYHGASLDIIADQQVDNLHFELSYRYWRVVFVKQILYLNLSWLLAMQGTVVKVRKVKGILILIQVFSIAGPIVQVLNWSQGPRNVRIRRPMVIGLSRGPFTIKPK